MTATAQLADLLPEVSPGMQLAMIVLLAISGFVLGRVVLGVSRDQSRRFDLEELVLTNGKTDLKKFIYVASFIMATWLIVYLAMTHQLTEGYVGLYLTAYVSPIVAAIIWHKPDPTAAGA